MSDVDRRMRPDVAASREPRAALMFHVEHSVDPPAVVDAASFSDTVGVDISVMEDLERYRAMLEEASASMNLVGPSALVEFWPRHAWDSAQLLPLLHGATTIADIGAGAGFPGLVLAILLKGRAGARVHLVESMGKRCRFLREVANALALPVEVHATRAEALDPPPPVEVVTARACAPLPRLLDYAWPFLRTGARGLFLKGRSAEAELAEARRTWRLTAELIPSRSDPSGRIIALEEAARVRR